jgi:hypothetical protein
MSGPAVLPIRQAGSSANNGRVVPESLPSLLNDPTQSFTEDVLNIIGVATLVEIVAETAQTPKTRAVGLPSRVGLATYSLFAGQADVLEQAALGETIEAIAAARRSSALTVKRTCSTCFVAPGRCLVSRRVAPA